MMNYVERILQPGESVLHAARLHWFIYLKGLALLLLALVCVMFAVGSNEPGISIPLWLAAGVLGLLGAVLAIAALIEQATTELVLTDRRVIYKRGLLKRHTMEMNRSKVETVSVNQSVLGRLLNYGTVIVRGTGGSLEPIRKIDDPLTFRSHITAGYGGVASRRGAGAELRSVRRSGNRPRGGLRGGASLSIGLSAVIVAASVQEPRVLTIKLSAGAAPTSLPPIGVEALPSGPLEAEHRTLEIGLRGWVERQTSQTLGYVEQLYTFGDRDRSVGDDALDLPALVVAYLALVREARPAGSADAEWRNWYRYFPWEDWRDGRPALLDPIETALAQWAYEGARREGGEAERRLREERVGLAFGLAFGPSGAAWNEELVLERYELLYEAGLVSEAARDFGRPGRFAGRLEHRGGNGGGPSPHSRHRDRPAARQDQISSGRLRADAARLYAAAIAAHRRGAGWGTVAQAEFPPPRRAAGSGRGNRRDQRAHWRPTGAARPLPPRGTARTPRPRPAPAPRCAAGSVI